jgi:hypothetical protein
MVQSAVAPIASSGVFVVEDERQAYSRLDHSWTNGSQHP